MSTTMSTRRSKVAAKQPIFNSGYPEFLAQLKASIRQRQYQALRAVNRELATLHMEIGQAIHQTQAEEGWGKAVLQHQVDNQSYLPWFRSGGAVQIRAEGDNPTIGLLLCKQQNHLVAEYALSGIEKTIGVAEYQLMRDLPETLGQSLPSIEAIEAELAADAQYLTDVDALQ